jgi:hypothetical protein
MLAGKAGFVHSPGFFYPLIHGEVRPRSSQLPRLWGKDPIGIHLVFWPYLPVVKMVSLGRAVFWWETARFLLNSVVRTGMLKSP